jgi:deoxyribodipyrimidine photo-lyase
MSTAIVWFRRDLRISDNPALAAAAEADRLVPVFCFETALLRGRHASPSRNAYLLASLRELDESLRHAGSRLHYRSGDPAVELAALAAECGADRTHVNRDHTAYARSRDRRVRAALAALGCELVGHDGLTCAEIGAIKSGAGGPYRVFTPFSRAWEGADRRALAARPRRLPGPGQLPIGRPPAAAAVAVDAAAKRIAAAGGPGEREAGRLMREAVESADSYPEVRNDAGADATTHLSPALHFGTVSARELESKLIAKRSPGADALRRQLAWRDFWLHVIRFNPGNREEEFDPRFRRMPWRWEPETLEAWKLGRTGVPWIDAGMRQLLAQGWMHNRVRMAVAAYLTKNLLIDWREGEAHFMRHLLDGDEAQNNGNWQWSASVGADAQPYFRVFNPVRQQRRFDPDGVYVRRWVPEIAALPDGHLAAPWDAPAEVQADAGCLIGVDYPAPLVDLGSSRGEAIERFRAQREESAGVRRRGGI